MVTVVAEQAPGNPAPAVGVTITGLGSGDSVVSLWRVLGGAREAVPGSRRVVMSDADYVTDYFPPFGVQVVYEVEVISGPSGPSRTVSDPVIVESDTGWIMDPLIPQTAVPIVEPGGAAGRPVFASSAMAALEYAAPVSLYTIMGADKPMALFGQRMAAAGVDLSLITDAAEESNLLRELFMSSAVLSVRLPPSWGSPLPGACFASVASVSENPAEGGGGSLTVWQLTGDTVSAPTIRVLTATFTYGDVEMLTLTYQQKQDLMAGKTYLDDLKNPLG